MRHIKVIIIGAGPCGVSTAINLKKESIECAIIEFSTVGGKINIAPRVDNYPQHSSIPGPDLAYEFYLRCKDNNIEIIQDEVIELKKEKETFFIKCQYETYTSDIVVIASGTKERKLGFPNEETLFGHGISYCAICDGHFFKNKDVAIIGGGNSALKEALYLAPSVNKLYLIHRRNEFRGLNKLVDELSKFSNVEILTPYEPVEFLGSDKVCGLIIRHKESLENKTLKVDGIFPLVGQIPNTKFVHIDGVKDEKGNIPVNKTMSTPVENLYAGGDVLPRDIRQIYLSEYDGKVIAKSIIGKVNQ